MSKIIIATNSSSKVKYLPELAGDIKHSLASIKELISASFRANSDFDSGLKKTISFFASNQAD